MSVLGVNHIGLQTPDIARLRNFYAELLGAESLEGEHAPLRAGTTLLVFFESAEAAGGDELAFDTDAAGFEEVLARAKRMGVLEGELIRWNEWSRGFHVRDPDGRTLEFIHNDHGVFWR